MKAGLVALAATVSLGFVPAPASAATEDNTVTSVTVAMIENHSVAQIKTGMPKTYALASEYAIGAGLAFRHPSQPNYLGVWSSSTQGVTDDNKHKLKAPSYFDVVPSLTGAKVKTYTQGMGLDRCRLSDRGPYRVKHNPQTSFLSGSVTVNGVKVTKRSLCEKYNFDAFNSRHVWQKDLAANKLGVLNHLLADQNHEWHDGTARQADDFFSARIREFIASPAYANGGVLVVTADEDNKKGVNDVPFYVFHKSLAGDHLDAGDSLSLLQLSAFLAEVADVPPLTAAAADESGKFATAFHLS